MPRDLYSRVGFIVTNMSTPAENVVAFYNKRGTAERSLHADEARRRPQKGLAHRGRPRRASVFALQRMNLKIVLGEINAASDKLFREWPPSLRRPRLGPLMPSRWGRPHHHRRRQILFVGTDLFQLVRHGAGAIRGLGRSTRPRSRPPRRRSPGLRSRGGRGFQEALMISPVSGSAAAATSSAGRGSRRHLAFD